MRWRICIIFFLAVFVLSSTSRNEGGHANNAVLSYETAPDQSAEEVAVTVVCTVDGAIHGIDKFGRKIWSSNTGDHMVSANNHVVGLSGKGRQQKRNYAVLPTIDGSLIYSSMEGMRKTRLTAKMLAAQSPFFSPEGVSFTGTTHTRMLSLDARSGEVLFDSDGKLRTVQRAGDAVPIWFGRVDYHVRAVDAVTGKEEFNLTFSELQPVAYDPAVYKPLPEQSSLAPPQREEGGDRESSAVVVVPHGDGGEGRQHADPDSIVSAAQEREQTRQKDRNKRRVGAGRRKRKSRMRMEQRAGELRALRERLAEHALTALDPAALVVVSTPEGALYFADGDGVVLDRVPVSLQSPVMQAFHLQRATAAVDGQPEGWGIRAIGVHHRIVTEPFDDADPVEESAISATAVTALCAGCSSVRSEEAEVSVVVQSPDPLHPAAVGGGMPVFAMEVREQALRRSIPSVPSVPDTRRGKQQEAQQGLIGGAAEKPLLPAPPPAHAPAAQPTRAIGHSAAKRLLSERQILGRSGAGWQDGRGLPVLTKRKMRPAQPDTKRAAISPPLLTALGEGSAASIEQNVEEGLSGDSCQCPLPYGPPAPPCSNGGGEDVDVEVSDNAGLEAAGGALGLSWERYLVEVAEPQAPALRGRHVLRPDLYEGLLFQRDGRVPLFEGVLEHGPGREAGKARVSPQSAETSYSPGPARLESRWRLGGAIFVRVMALAQQLLALAVAVALVAVLLLGSAVAVARSLPGLKERFPAEESAVLQAVRMAYAVIAYVLDLPVTDAEQGNGQGSTHPVSKWQGGESAQQPAPVPELSAPLASLVMPAEPSPSSPVEGVDSQGRRTLQVGSLVLLPDEVLGYGSHGTVVYRGSLHGRPLAVKRVLSQFVKSADREIALLIRSDGHPNVVRYYTKEEHSDFVYLGLQLCDMTLAQFVMTQLRPQDSGRSGEISEGVRTALLQVAAGLAHLHANKIVHRDLKPHNILCCSPEGPGGELRQHGKGLGKGLGGEGVVLKISDMGLSKQLQDRDHHSHSLSSAMAAAVSVSRGLHTLQGWEAGADTAVGTMGWQAPELVLHRYRPQEPQQVSPGEVRGAARGNAAGNSAAQGLSFSVDVFSLGCVFYFTITHGDHPYGRWFEREANIAADKADLSGVQQDALATDLLRWMLHAQPQQRPTSRQVCGHAFFWTAAQRLHFLVEFSDRLEQEPADAAVVLALEQGGAAIVQGSWDRRLDPLLLSDLSRFRRYDTASVRDLLRVVRNKRHHFHELAPELRATMGEVPDGFLRYFESRFPCLALLCVAVAGWHLAGEANFSVAQDATSPSALDLVAQEASSLFSAPSPPAHVDLTEKQSGSVEDGSPSAVVPDPLDATENRQPRLSPVTQGWWLSADSWAAQAPPAASVEAGRVKARAAKIAQDAKHRTRLCTQWEESCGTACSMRKKGKCDFAHGPLELRAKESRRGKWGRPLPGGAGDVDLVSSGGENALGEARLLDSGRRAAVAASTAAGGEGPVGVGYGAGAPVAVPAGVPVRAGAGQGLVSSAPSMPLHPAAGAYPVHNGYGWNPQIQNRHQPQPYGYPAGGQHAPTAAAYAYDYGNAYPYQGSSGGGGVDGRGAYPYGYSGVGGGDAGGGGGSGGGAGGAAAHKARHREGYHPNSAASYS